MSHIMFIENLWRCHYDLTDECAHLFPNRGSAPSIVRKYKTSIEQPLYFERFLRVYYYDYHAVQKQPHRFLSDKVR